MTLNRFAARLYSLNCKQGCRSVAIMKLFRLLFTFSH